MCVPRASDENETQRNDQDLQLLGILDRKTCICEELTGQRNLGLETSISKNSKQHSAWGSKLVKRNNCCFFFTNLPFHKYFTSSTS